LFILVFIKTLYNIIEKLKVAFKKFVLFLALIFFIIISLSLTDIPFWMYYNLGVPEHELKTDPEYIVVMSGAGIPSASGLMRTYRTAEMGKKFPKAKIIVTMPGVSSDTTSASFLMKKEIVIRGIEANRISFENKGTNTRSQALAIKKIVKNNPPILVISSPEHLYRSVASFHKAGLTNSVGEPAFAQSISVSFAFDDVDLGGNTFIPDIGNNTHLRYQFWSNLKFQVIVYREYTAITFYRLKGWI